MRKMRMIFTTTPNRVKTPKFGKFFGTSARDTLPEIDLSACLKRREPKADPLDPSGIRVIPGDECSQEEFMRGAALLLGKGFGKTLINAENEWRDREDEILSLPPEAGVLISGSELTADSALEMLGRCRGRIRFLALENEEALLAGARLIREERPDGLVIGSSYLSESSRLYDTLGLERYRSLLRALGSSAAREGIEVYTTSNYCTFDPAGKGDRNESFVKEQVQFISERGDWGSITRYYAHLQWVREQRIAMGFGEGGER